MSKTIQPLTLRHTKFVPCDVDLYPCGPSHTAEVRVGELYDRSISLVRVGGMDDYSAGIWLPNIESALRLYNAIDHVDERLMRLWDKVERVQCEWSPILLAGPLPPNDIVHLMTTRLYKRW